MKTTILKLAVIALLAGTVSCESKDDDMDMSEIDFNNIENLYAQPLPVIQKAIQGKWKHITSCGGFVGCVDVKNVFITFAENEIISDNTATGEHSVKSYSWKKKKIQDPYNSDLTVDSYMMWPDDAYEYTQSGQVFEYIANDTLYERSYSLVSEPIVFGMIYVRVK
jgi:hypothetical protein